MKEEFATVAPMSQIALGNQLADTFDDFYSSLSLKAL